MSATAASTRRDFLAAYLAELEHFASLAPGRIVTSIFFGGGTPSLMQPETVGAILDRIAEHWTDRRPMPRSRSKPIRHPSRPDGSQATVRPASTALSLGVQALDDASLKALGRKHTSEEALAALALAKRNFERVSFDLIYARRRADGARLARGAHTRARPCAGPPLALSAHHRGGHAVRRAPRRRRAEHAGGRRRPSAFYLLTQELCEAAGLPSYEVSNHARPGAESRHNLLYWRGHDYAGVGPGAHSRITRDGIKACHRGSQVAGSLARRRRDLRPRHRAATRP